jgi:lycopene beta-cyclase
MAYFDYIIAGGGASGLVLAYQMAMSSLRGSSILIVERDAKDQNDRTWGYWASQPTILDHLSYRSWDQVEFISDTFQQIYDLRPYQYRMIRGIDFYQGMRDALSSVPEIQWKKGRVTEVSDAKDKKAAQVIIDDVPYGSKYAFDSIFTPSDYFDGPHKFHYLKKSFKAWEVETPSDCFDSRTVTFFDFRTPQRGAMCYFYMLPFTRRRAIVEYVVISADLRKPHEYDRAIGDYLENVRRAPQYRINAVESGVIPMTDFPFPRKLGDHVLSIGTKGGLVKPATGETFTRILKDSRAIVHSMTEYGVPFRIPAAPGRYHLFDSAILQIMHRQGSQMKNNYTRLFKRNSIQSILRFFDEEAGLAENLHMFSSIPISPFLKALLRVKLLRKV